MSSKQGSGDKRTVTTDALETLGTIITENERRDAIHLAVENVTAKQKLYPGQDVGPDGTVNNPVGIVDPFLKQPVLPGERFWLVVYPRQIHSLRHVWTHPAFPDPLEIAEVSKPSKEESEQWLREFIARSDCPSFDTVIEAAVGGANYDEYLHFDGQDAHGEIPPEFWDHLEVYTGARIAKERRASWFSCSC